MLVYKRFWETDNFSMRIKVDYVVFGVADHDSDVRIWKFKMAATKWQLFSTTLAIFFTMSIKLDILRVFGVADYDSDVRIWKLKMAATKWQPFFSILANFF